LLVEVLESRNEPFRREGRVSLYADFLIVAALHNVRGGVGDQIEGRNDAFGKLVSHGRQADAATFAPEQLYTQIFFEHIELLAHRRLPYMQFPGCPGEIPGTSDDLECP